MLPAINMDNTTLYIISQILLFGCVTYLMFFKEYIKKKGTNLADKQDIEGITQKIEQVKDQFTKENEFLKANLQFIINNQLQHSNEERNAIMTFFDTHSKWINIGLSDLSFNNYQRNNIDDLVQKERHLDDLYTQTNITQSRISLLIDNPDLIQLSHKLIQQTLEYHHWTKMLLLKLRLNLQADKSNFDIFIKLIEAKPMPQEVKISANREQELIKERKKLCEKYYAEKVNNYKQVLAISKQFTDIVKSHLAKRL